MLSEKDGWLSVQVQAPLGPRWQPVFTLDGDQVELNVTFVSKSQCDWFIENALVPAKKVSGD
ncbi:hypothetical protein [Streptomyces sp. 5-10]|uniref:hypothetical protein n=1 Tax=Streptomyces sp. 5-10 TaxID=878925 RepID=UPI00168B19F2|nr:hypothetical protein [Streptomyces sp. 5-10]MBD3004650.1 hypothetical protein [Streptomyces sp. 5-10]